MRTLLVFTIAALFTCCNTKQKKDFNSFINELEKEKIIETYKFYKIGPLRNDIYSITYPDGSYYSFAMKDSLIRSSIDPTISDEKYIDLKMKLAEMTKLNIKLIESDSCLMQIRVDLNDFAEQKDAKDKTDVLFVYYYKEFFDSEKSQRHFKALSPKNINENWYFCYRRW